MARTGPRVLRQGAHGLRQTAGGDVVEGDGLQDGALAGAKRDPHLLEAARRTVVVDVFGAFAPHVRERAVDRADDVGEGDLPGRTGQPVPPYGTPLAAHQTGAAQLGEDVLKEFSGNGLGARELFGRHRTATGGSEFGRGAQRVIDSGRKAHAAIMPCREDGSGQSVGRRAAWDCC